MKKITLQDCGKCTDCENNVRKQIKDVEACGDELTLLPFNIDYHCCFATRGIVITEEGVTINVSLILRLVESLQ